MWEKNYRESNTMLRRKPDKALIDTGINNDFWIRHNEVSCKIIGKKVPVTSATITLINKYFDHFNLTRPSTQQVTALLNNPLTQGDMTKTFNLIRFYQLSQRGLFVTNESIDKAGNAIKYIGAENWELVMCYMDALLFAMFTNLDSFEPMLFLSNQNSNVQQTRLSTLLRVYINLLRSGNVIKTDLTIRICECLYLLGFIEALSHKQQDSATLFEFLTESLRMPLLTFKVDIQHGGKFNEQDDRKYSKERMLFVSLPDQEESDGDILLEECLEHYFNNSISVKRELERRATLERTQDSTKNQKPTIELIDHDPADLTSSSPTKLNAQVHVRTRSSTLSIWTMNGDEPNSKPREVNLPAWMFLRLLPFYTDDNEVSDDSKNNGTAKNSREFAKRRPVLPICLKRYYFEDQKANRLKLKVIIPPIIHLPSFVADENDDSKSSHNYKLILESAVCHRGTSISSGHFVSAVRKNHHLINESDEDAHNSPWYLYDDLHKPKVLEKSFNEIFTTEWPYILFYRLVSYEESGSSANSLHSFPTSAASSTKIVVPPQGSRDKYWTDDPLSPILSATNSPSLDPESSGIESLRDSLKDSMKTTSSTESSAVSSENGISSEVSPIDPKFVDIREKYYWYIPDQNMDYYKEEAGSKPSTRRTSLTTNFRRNSQWSENSQPAKKVEVSQDVESSPSSSVWSFKRKGKNSKSPLPLETHEIETTISHISLGSPEPIKSIPPKQELHKHHLLHRHKTHLHEPAKLSKQEKAIKQKREAYRKEKCVIC